MSSCGATPKRMETFRYDQPNYSLGNLTAFWTGSMAIAWAISGVIWQLSGQQGSFLIGVKQLYFFENNEKSVAQGLILIYQLQLEEESEPLDDNI